MNHSLGYGTSSGGLNTGGNLSESFLDALCRQISFCCLELLITFKNESDMIQKFIELHDSDTTNPYLLHVIESYQTIKEML